MKNHSIAMKKRVKALALALLLTVGSTSMAQNWSQNTACPGWNNPTSFTQGNSQNYYTGCGGSVAYGKPDFDVMTGETGVTWSSSIFTASQMATAGAAGCGGSNYGTIPNHDKMFAIMTTSSQAPGHPVNKDPNTGDRLPFVPTQFNTTDTTPGFVNTNLQRSIRVGDDCHAGGQNGASALFYNMYVTTDNAIMILYYATVVENPGHGITGDPTFIIRVQKQNASGQWVQISDTLAYMVASTPASSGGSIVFEPNFNTNGWHQAYTGYNGVNYKDWTKVVLNLSNLLYENVRVEVMINDCYYNAHYAYAYVAGECRRMALLPQGCPPGMSTDVATIQAPRGMQLYEWSASEYGKSDPLTRLDDPDADAYFTFRTLASGTEAQGYSTYHTQTDDFRVVYRPNNNHVPIPVYDSVGERQTFRCRMTSALDPAKPFTSDMFITVTNTKPKMDIDTLSLCDGTVKMWNQSYVPGAQEELVVDSLTRWTIYNNPDCLGEPLDTLFGDSIAYTFSDTEVHGVIVRTNTSIEGCYSEAMYTVKPLATPRPGMTLSKHVLCDADETTITDTTTGTQYREWYFLRGDATSTGPSAPRDTVKGFGNYNNAITRPFTHNVEPIGLMVRNGMYYINPYNTGDTIWCQANAYDTVAVFVHPELEVSGDTIVCQGSKTDALVRAVGVEGCTYEWSRSYGSITGGIPAGDRLQVTPYADTSTYYVRVTSPQGCVAWDSINAYLVRPVLTMLPTDGIICPGDTVVLTGTAADHYSWQASPADPSMSGQENADVITVTPQRTTVYTMIGHGTNDCDASPLTKKVTVRPLPIPKISTDPGFVDTDDPTVVIRDVSQYGVSSSWLFDDGTTSTNREVTHTFRNAIGQDSVYVELTAANVLNCTTTRTFGIPVELFTAWFPNIFTPGSEDDNAIFRLYTVNVYENFHIYIYNRYGALVFESDQPDFEWDGTYNGTPCPQGVYAYVCNYRKPGTNTLSAKNGTITLIR